ncbi:MAG: hypothetical protein ACRDKY_02900 [Solirubrobacteraceae bacterium]
MSHYCSECHAYWWPYQTKDGACPQCHGGTRRSYEPADDSAPLRHRNALDDARSRELHEQFEAYYAEREARRFAA